MHRLVIALIIFLFGALVWQNRAALMARYDGEAEFSYYQNSRYVRGDKSDYIPSDSRIYALKGYLFVGKNLDLLKFEPGHPPLSSYFMGISILFFKNPLYSNLLFGVLTLVVFYLLALELTKSKLIASLAALLLFLEPVFSGQLTETLLDIYQLFFALLSVLLYFLWWRQPRFHLIALSQISLGLVLASKFFLSGIPLLFALFLPTIFSGNFRRFRDHTLALFFVGLGFLLGQITFFLYHPSLFEFARYQRYVLNWWAGSPQVAPFGVWDLIFRNRWHTWWDNQAIVAAAEWSFTWPLIVGLGLISLPLLLVRHRADWQIAVLWFWQIFVLVQLSFTAVFPRHLLFVLPASLLLAALIIRPKYN